MSEVEAVCGRVIIIAQGRIAVDEAIDTLRQDKTILVEARGPVEAMRKAILAIDGVEKVQTTSSADGLVGFEVQTRRGTDLREAICQRLTAAGWPLRSLELRRSTLEERFVEAVTGENAAGTEVETF
jgi:ABC-2 type transport system ATP-binding protein